MTGLPRLALAIRWPVNMFKCNLTKINVVVVVVVVLQPRFGAKFVSVLRCCKFTFFLSKFAKRVELVLFLISLNLKLFSA